MLFYECTFWFADDNVRPDRFPLPIPLGLQDGSAQWRSEAVRQERLLLGLGLVPISTE